MEPGGVRRPLSCPGSALGNKGRWGRVQTSDTTALPHSGTPGPSTWSALCVLRLGVQGELGGRSHTHVAQRSDSSTDLRPFWDLQGQTKI